MCWLLINKNPSLTRHRKIKNQQSKQKKNFAGNFWANLFPRRRRRRLFTLKNVSAEKRINFARCLCVSFFFRRQKSETVCRCIRVWNGMEQKNVGKRVFVCSKVFLEVKQDSGGVSESDVSGGWCAKWLLKYNKRRRGKISHNYYALRTSLC